MSASVTCGAQSTARRAAGVAADAASPAPRSRRGTGASPVRPRRVPLGGDLRARSSRPGRSTVVLLYGAGCGWSWPMPALCTTSAAVAGPSWWCASRCRRSFRFEGPWRKAWIDQTVRRDVDRAGHARRTRWNPAGAQLGVEDFRWAADHFDRRLASTAARLRQARRREKARLNAVRQPSFHPCDNHLAQMDAAVTRASPDRVIFFRARAVVDWAPGRFVR